jgi:hypothetical protein
LDDCVAEGARRDIAFADTVIDTPSGERLIAGDPRTGSRVPYPNRGNRLAVQAVEQLTHASGIRYAYLAKRINDLYEFANHVPMVGIDKQQRRLSGDSRALKANEVKVIAEGVEASMVMPQRPLGRLGNHKQMDAIRAEA